MVSKLIIFLVQVLIFQTVTAHMKSIWSLPNPAIDPTVIEDALDSDLCRQQLRNLLRLNNTLLRFRFLDAGLRIPKSILEFNNVDMGNYDQCLGIYEELEDSVIEGKYCMIEGPFASNLTELADVLHWSDYTPDLFDEDYMKKYRQIEDMNTKLVTIRDAKDPRSMREETSQLPGFRMALCIPKVCTTQEGMRGLYLLSFPSIGLHFREEFCRVKDDKTWAPVDYVAIVVFSLIGFITILSTAYDVWWQFIAKKDPKAISTIGRTFSVYTNGKRLTTFTSNPNNLNCVDGIRAISMFWIIVGHTYSLLPPTMNNLYVLEYVTSLRSLWVSAAPYTVDTFFFLSGLLVVYTTAGKLNSQKLLSNLHLFYLNRILRMFPLLAAVILAQASILNRASDGPIWSWVEFKTNNCRKHWWLTLLYVQNYIGYDEPCINHSWYLAIDMHCYIVCPLVLYFVLSGKKKAAWISLACGLLTALIAGTTYSFVYKFPGWLVVADDRGHSGEHDYHLYYYFNTLTRASPFFVGMVFGYILYLWKGHKPQINKLLAVFLWFCSGTVAFLLMYITHLMKDVSWKAGVADDLVNSFARPLWAVTVGWVIFACQHGYGGPINWFLSLDLWKLPSRISYAMYLFHFPIQFVIQGTARSPIIFYDAVALYEFLSQAVIAFGIAFGMTLIVDSPFSVLFKLLLDDGPKKPKKEVPDKE